MPVITALLDAGASPDGVNDEKYYTRPALHVAIELRDCAIVKLLLERGARVREETGLENPRVNPDGHPGYEGDSLVVALRADCKDIYEMVQEAKMARTSAVVLHFEEAKEKDTPYPLLD